jgi:hypothetical protein
MIAKIWLFKVFNATFGVLIRGVQMTLRRAPSKGVHFYLNQKAVQESAEYALTNFSQAQAFYRRERLWDYCLNKVNSPVSKEERPCLIAEFGVFRGESINYFAKKCPNANIFGFDSFEGLEENWFGSFQLKGSLDLAGKMPKCLPNVKLFKGWFEETVPSFIENLNGSQINFLHMDADTYKPTAYVLNALSDYIGKGTIIIFDEYFGYPGYQLHEFKAWHEFVKSKNVKYSYLGFTDLQVAIQIN